MIIWHIAVKVNFTVVNLPTLPKSNVCDFVSTFPKLPKNNQMNSWMVPKTFWPLTTCNISEMPNLGAPFRDHAYLFLARWSRWGIMRSYWDHECLGNVTFVVTEQVVWNSELCLWNCPACIWSMFSIHRPVRHA